MSLLLTARDRLYTIDEIVQVAQAHTFIHEVEHGAVVGKYLFGGLSDTVAEDGRVVASGPPTFEKDVDLDALRAKGAVFRTHYTKYTGCDTCPRADHERCIEHDLLRYGRQDNEPVDILCIFSQPDSDRDRWTNEPTGHPTIPGDQNSVLRRVFRVLGEEDPKAQCLSVSIVFAAQCRPTLPDEKPSAAVMRACQPNLAEQVARLRPRLIVAFGAHAVKQLGAAGTPGDLRGRVLEPAQSGLAVPLLVTFSERAVAAAAGLYRTFEQDMRNGVQRLLRGSVQRSLESLSEHYLIPTTIDEALDAVRHVREYTARGIAPESWWVSVDTETTSLHAWKEGARVIAFCFGWDTGKATTVLFDHPLAPKEYLERLPELEAEIRLLLDSEKPKTFHNAKFDLKWIELRYQLPVRNVRWCSLLGEHLLDEDKKGNYGLKALTTVWLPHFCGYEDKLYDILEAQDQGKVGEVEALLSTLGVEHAEFAAALRSYQEELERYAEAEIEHQAMQAVYEAQKASYEEARAAHKAAMEEYAARPKKPKKPEKPKQPKGAAATDEDFAAYPALLKSYEEALTAWESWENPEKPVFDLERPTKPARLDKAPKAPEDPRSRTEKNFNTDAGFERIPLHDLQVYGAVDSDVTRQLTSKQRGQITKETGKLRAQSQELFPKGPESLMLSHGIPGSRVLGHMEYYGIRIDKPYAQTLQVELTKLVDSSYAALCAAASAWPEFNPASGAHIAGVLYHQGWVHPDGTRMDVVPCLEKTKKTQKESTTEAALKPHLQYEEVLNPNTGKIEQKSLPGNYFIEQLFTYKKATKARDTFLANVLVLSAKDGWLRTNFHLNGTGTGRLASSTPNLQNTPKKLSGWSLKRLFVPDNDELLCINADYKGAEVRVFTVYAPDPALIKALNDGLDMHSFFASRVFNLPYEDFQGRDNDKLFSAEYRAKLDKLRTQIKRVVFGILYGAGPTKIAESIGSDIDSAKEVIALLFDMFPAIKQYIENTNFNVDKYQYVETVFGRRRRFPLVSSERHRARAHRQAGNFKIQSTSSDIVLGQLIEMYEMIHSDAVWPQWGINEPLHKMGVRLLLTVHDSIVLQWPKKLLHALEPWMRYYGEERVREKYPWLPVPFSMDIEVGPSYGECVALAKYIAAQALQTAKLDAEAQAALHDEHTAKEEELEILTGLREDAFANEG